jgi:hypothetical protein
LQIRVETDASANSSLFIDDVSLRASPLAAVAQQNPGDPQQNAPKANTLAPNLIR